MSETPYRGRFAPSPTGPLHFGSLIAATGSYLQARAHQGEWWLRIEDLDPPREPKGTATQIIKTLEAFGFEWDGPVHFQSRHLEHYAEIINELAKTGRIYSCSCSRKQIAQLNPANTRSPVYPGTCRDKRWQPAQGHFKDKSALRIDTRNACINFEDAIQGKQAISLEQQGDYIIQRADGLFSYQLAVAVDDTEQGMTEVVRGADLLESTARQIYLQQQLQLPSPAYAHLPIAYDRQTGKKLSKQTHAPALEVNKAVYLLWKALKFLGQQPEAPLLEASIDELWTWAMVNWKLKFVSKAADTDK